MIASLIEVFDAMHCFGLGQEGKGCLMSLRVNRTLTIT